MEQYIIDTNVVSGYLSGSISNAGMDFTDSIIDAVPIICVITQIELLCWNTDVHTQQKVKNFIDDSTVINITSEVIEACVNIRRVKKIKTPDAIIAASALAYELTLITNNEKDFANIKGLKILNPHKM